MGRAEEIRYECVTAGSGERRFYLRCSIEEDITEGSPACSSSKVLNEVLESRRWDYGNTSLQVQVQLPLHVCDIQVWLYKLSPLANASNSSSSSSTRMMYIKLRNYLVSIVNLLVYILAP